MKKEYVYVLKEEYTETNNENIRLTAENIELNIELQRKDNIINGIKELCDEYDTKMHLDDTIYIDKEFYEKLLDKIKELENEYK